MKYRFLFLLALSVNSVFAQVDYKKLETAWCKNHPDYLTDFAISNYETAYIPIAFDKSISLTGWRTFFNNSIVEDKLVTSADLFYYFEKCFKPYLDSVLFKGPTLYCARLCRDGKRAFASVQYVNDGQNYFLSIIETDRTPPPISAERLTAELKQNGFYILWNDSLPIQNDVNSMHEIVRAQQQNPDWIIGITTFEDDLDHTIKRQRIRAVQNGLVKAGVDSKRLVVYNRRADFVPRVPMQCSDKKPVERMVLYIEK